MAFVHLHNHTDYSMLDSSMRVKAMVVKAVELGMPAVAITDHGFMYGVPELAEETAKVNHAEPDWRQWSRDRDDLSHGREMPEPEEPAKPHSGGSKARERWRKAHAEWERSHAQWERDVACAAEGRDLAEVEPAPRIKPIYGCEVYLMPDSTLARDRRPELYHLILLAKNKAGYVNLMKIVSDAATRGFHYLPRVSLESLREHAEGLICTSGCFAGIVAREIIEGRVEEAISWAETLRDLFAPGDFYIEILDHGLGYGGPTGVMTDRQVGEQLVAIARRIGVKVVCTNDVHYLDCGDALAQDVLTCVGQGGTLDDPCRLRMPRTETGEGEFYLKSEEEMRELFSWIPEAADATIEIADKCNVEFEWGRRLLPAFPLDPGETNESQLRRDCEAGLARRYGEDWKTAHPDVMNRFECEYQIICAKGLAAYFLIVADYVGWAKRNGIRVGPGRGNAGGSIVAFALGITTVEPIENGLLFERFLSSESPGLPNIAIDFDAERRDEVIDYVRCRYGRDHVARVIAFVTLDARQAVKDAAHVLGKPIYLADKLTKMISGLDPKLRDAIERSDRHPEPHSSDLARAYRKDPEVREVIDTARSIEGLVRHEGVNSCAVVITPGALNESVPTKLDTKGEVEITQFEGHTVADMGLLRIDFLGLRTLTVISKALQNIRANHGVEIDIDEIPFDDPATFELLSSGQTAGVFQVESEGMTATIKSMRPTEFKHVVAIIALDRPAPLDAGMTRAYINRNNGEVPPIFYDDRLSGILDETYGMVIYQEQVMRIAETMSGFSPAESDRVRKAIARKKINLMTKVIQHWEDGTDETMEEHWVGGAVRNGYRREVAKRIWNDVLEFASCAFNKSHAAGYAVLVMQTAWLKAHYPREFMAAVLTSHVGNTEKIAHYVNACHTEGIDVLQPDVNESGRDFAAPDEGIRFGLAGIKGVSADVADAIVAERERGGPYRHLHDFVGRVPAEAMDRRVVDALIKAGAFDSTGYTRRQLLGFTDKTDPADGVDASRRARRISSQGQGLLLDAADGDGAGGFALEAPAPDGIEFDRLTKLSFETEVLGLPLDDQPARSRTSRPASSPTPQSSAQGA